MSRFQTNTLGVAGSILNAAGSLFGGFFNQVENAAYHMQRAVGGKAHDSALEKAVEDGKGYFKQCTRCGHWVCPDVCWNHKAGLCEHCAPDEHEELAAQQALATQEQIHQKTREVNYVKDIDFNSRSSVQQCESCHAKLTPQNKFCPECGIPNSKAQQKEKFCSDCGAKVKGDQRFCAECGTRQD
jgi:uncharacterized OB-fold protein